MLKDFALPDLGEGLTESEIVSWHVEIGDRVELNQILGEVETAKALVELPSPFAGVVSKLYAEPGTTVQVGSPIVAFELEDTGSGEDGDASDLGPQTAGGPAGSREPGGRQPVLVGYGPPIEDGSRPSRRRRSGSTAGTVDRGIADRAAAAPAAASAPTAPAAAVGDGAIEDRIVAAQGIVDDATADEGVVGGSAADAAASLATVRPRSTPPVRKLAHDLGVDLALVTGTGEDGLITRTDVESYVTEGAGAPISVAADGSAPPEPALAGSGGRRETRFPIAGVRKRTAEAMVASAFTAPQATEFLTVDVTAALELIESLKSAPGFRDKRLSILTLAAKALCIAVARTPEINSRWDGGAGEIVQYGYVNLGIAAATQRGLLVPNVKDADRMPLADLADAIAQLVDEARAGRTVPSGLTGGTITITNVGVFGIDTGTPILNPGEAGILALGAVRRLPWEYRGEVALRQVMTLSVTFDHRLVDGAQGSRFLTDIGAILAEPGVALSMV